MTTDTEPGEATGPAAEAAAGPDRDPPAGPEPPRPARRSLAARLRSLPSRPAAHVAAYGLMAALAVAISAPGRHIGENRVDQYVAPGHRLVRTLFLWDPSRGLGRTREDLWPLQLAPLSLLRGLGLSPIAAQRVWHAILITVAAAGAAAVLRAVRDDRRNVGEPAALRPSAASRPSADALAPFVAGLIYGFGPYSITFLTPANLYTAYALAPWVVLCAWRGVRSERPWASAAAAALLVASLGNADLPGVVMAMTPVPIVALVSARRAGRPLRAGAAWLARAGVLTVGVSAAALWKTAAAASVFTQRLTTTESPATVGVASSWSESLRGLGFWLSYFRGPELARPQTASLFTDPVIVLATFVPAALAFAALALPEVRDRVLWGLMLVIGAAVMVGVHPASDPVPLGAALLELYERSAFATGFRTTYKAGAGPMLAVAVLAGLATVALAERIGRRGQGRVVFSVGVVALLAVSGLPMWTGDLYDETRSAEPIPAYWREAARAINDLPGDGRVLVLPATTRAVYRWGWVGDDILDSLITRPHAVDTSVPLSGPEAADILAAVSAAADDARHRPGAVAAVLRRLGIDHVVIRNDLDAEESRTLSSDRMDALRSDPSLRLIDRFGGEQRPAGTASSTATAQSRAPVELWAVEDPGPVGPRLAPPDAPLLVSGSGAALLPLGADGDLDSAGTVRFTGPLSAEQLVTALEADGRLVVTDTNRRRVTVVAALVRNESWTLIEDEDLDRPGGALFDTPGSQSVAWFRDATTITSDGAPRGGRGAQPWVRPAAAFDGLSSTWWQTTELRDQEGITLRVELREPQAVDTVRIEPLPAPPSATRVTEVTVRFSDGTSRALDVGSGPTEVQIDAGPSTWAEIEISGVAEGTPRPVGLREVGLGDLDLREWIALPDDVARQAAEDPTLAAAVAGAPLTVLAARDLPEAEIPVEPVLRRRVRITGDRSLSVRATVAPADDEEALLLAARGEECGGEDLVIDGEPVPLRLADPSAEIVPGVRLTVESCAPVTVDDGWHEMEGRAASGLDDLRLDTELLPVSQAEPGSVRVESARPDRIDLVVDAPDGGIVVTGQSFDPRWIATADGEPLGAAELHDGQSGWELPPGEGIEVTMEFRPARRFRLAVWISVATTVVCVILVLRRRTGGPQASARAASSA